MSVKPRTGADFAARHVRNIAIRVKIQRALAKIRETGPEHWEYESDLTKSPYFLSSRDLSDFRDEKPFKDHWILTEVHDSREPRRVWFGDAKIAAKYRPRKDQE